MKPFGRVGCWLLVAAGMAALLAVGLHPDLRNAVATFWRLLADGDRIRETVAAFGAAAPAVFVLLQILQVVLAPIPGEISGFVGGYIFGVWQGFVLSTLGLSAGSWINFTLGRFLGRRYVRRLVPAETLDRFDRAVRRQGAVMAFVLFIVPGFPKDYLCLFLGLSTLPTKVFLLMAIVGRMPGTLLLSLQGGAVFDRMYGLFGAVLAVCLLAAGAGFRYREPLYRWIEGDANPTPPAAGSVDQKTK